MSLFTRITERVFSYYHWRNQRAKTRSLKIELLSMEPIPSRRGMTPDAPLNLFERGLLIIARTTLEKLRSCDLCHRSNEQEYFLQYSDGYEVHVDCGAEYNDACSVDPSTQYLGESDTDWEARCHAMGFNDVG